MRKLMLVDFILVMLLSLSGCSKGDSSFNANVYKMQELKMVGEKN
jgi:outer membrane lipoprotein SlyB